MVKKFFSKIKNLKTEYENAKLRYEETKRKEELERKKRIEENKFIPINDEETKTTKYQCPKCKGYDISTKEIKEEHLEEKNGNSILVEKNFILKKCINCGHSQKTTTDDTQTETN